MQKQTRLEKDESLTNAYSLFVYAIRTQLTRDYYVRRLRTFFDYIKLLPNANIERRCNHFAAMATKDHNWTFITIIAFLQYQKDRVEREEITAATLYNFVKALKLFCEMSDVPIAWKKITRGLPKVRSFANDRAPTLEEIRKMTEYPDRRMKAIVYTMASSGIRLGAWDYLRWNDIEPVSKDGSCRFPFRSNRNIHRHYYVSNTYPCALYFLIEKFVIKCINSLLNLVVIISKEILCEDEPYMTFQVPNSTSSSGLPGILRIRMVRTFHITTLTSDYISNAVDPYSHGALAALNILRISKLYYI